MPRSAVNVNKKLRIKRKTNRREPKPKLTLFTIHTVALSVQNCSPSGKVYLIHYKRNLVKLVKLNNRNLKIIA